MHRRTVVTGLAGLAATTALPALGQAIGRQSNPYAQVDPYADPRNGGGGHGTGRPPAGTSAPRSVFDYQRGDTDSTSEDDAEEMAIAQKNFAPAIAEGGGPFPDRRIQDAMAKFAKPLIELCERKSLPWQFVVIREPQIDAWTTGGGKVAVSSGLIRMCDDPGELAAVAAHEMGHIVFRHALEHSRLIDAVVQLGESGKGDNFFGKLPPALIQGLNPGKLNSPIDILMAGYSREHEFQADEYSAELMQRVGLDPFWNAAMLTKLARFGFENGHHLLADVVLDHPPATERAANIAAKFGWTMGAAAQPAAMPGWDELKAAFPTDPKWKNG